jgi:class 3 adenylate cyclase
MIEAVRRYDGYVVQSTGDGIFALFGAPVAHEDHPQRALHASLRLQEELKRYSGRLREAGDSAIEGRVGVNTGEVVLRRLRPVTVKSSRRPLDTPLILLRGCWS